MSGYWSRKEDEDKDEVGAFCVSTLPISEVEGSWADSDLMFLLYPCVIGYLWSLPFFGRLGRPSRRFSVIPCSSSPVGPWLGRSFVGH